jgi:hypothetical protein
MHRSMPSSTSISAAASSVATCTASMPMEPRQRVSHSGSSPEYRPRRFHPASRRPAWACSTRAS